MTRKLLLLALILLIVLITAGCFSKAPVRPNLLGEWDVTRWDAPPQDAKSVDLICYRLIISDQSSNGSFYGDMSLYRIVYEDGTENSIDYPHSVFIENGYVCPDKQDISFEWSELQFEGKVNDKAFPDSMSGTWSVGWLAGPWEAQKQ